MESKLATFRLFVQHGRPLESSKEERDLRNQFEKFGRVTFFSTRRGEWRNSQVTFSNTEQAVKAKKELDKTRLNGMTLAIFFTKPSRRVLVRGLPNNVSFSDLKREFRGAVHVENDGEHVVAITFDTISVAQAAVGNSGMRTYRGRELSFDFGNEERGRRRHSSPPRRRSREVIRRRSPSPRTEYKKRSTTPPLRSVRKRSRSRSRSKSARVSSGKSAAKKLALSSSSSSSSSSLSRERKRSKPKKESVKKKSEEKGDEKKEIVEKKDELGMEDDAQPLIEAAEEPPIVVEMVEPIVAQQAAEEDAEEEDAEGACRDCVRLLDDLKNHVGESHADSHAVVQKATVKAWFEAHYSREGPNNNGGAGEIASAVTRTTLLAEVNAFLAHMGWQKWKTQSPLYKDWFLREVMALSSDDIRKGRNWSLFHKDGFAPGGSVDNARNKEQRMSEMVVKLRQYMN
jgi:hypothetical protein